MLFERIATRFIQIPNSRFDEKNRQEESHTEDGEAAVRENFDGNSHSRTEKG